VSRSGLSCTASFIVIEDGSPEDVTEAVAWVSGFELHRDGVLVSPAPLVSEGQREALADALERELGLDPNTFALWEL
jgi:hypothetical protein